MVKRLELHDTESVVAATITCYYNTGIESLAPPRLHAAMIVQHVIKQRLPNYQNKYLVIYTSNHTNNINNGSHNQSTYTLYMCIYLYIIDTRQIRRIKLNEFSFKKDVIYVAFTNS